MQRMYSNGDTISEGKAIGELFCNYRKNMFDASNSVRYPIMDLVRNYYKKIFAPLFLLLTATKSPGLDGFNAFFSRNVRRQWIPMRLVLLKSSLIWVRSSNKLII